MAKMKMIKNRLVKESSSSVLEIELGQNMGITQVGKKNILTTQLDKSEMKLLYDWLDERI